MLTYNKNPLTKSKDRPWLILIVVFIWIGGSAFFHSPWEPFEPFVFAVIKSIIHDGSWFIPYISNSPYLEIQPFYFWFYAVILKLLLIKDNLMIEHSIHLINTLAVLILVAIMGKIGSNLDHEKSGSTVMLILISTVGMVINAYQLTPTLLILLGFALYIYALNLNEHAPGISGWLLAISLILLSLNFDCEYILIGLSGIIIIPCLNQQWRTKSYYFSTTLAIIIFSIMFGIYVYQLKNVDEYFYQIWQAKYFQNLNFNHDLKKHIFTFFSTSFWYTQPSIFLFFWSLIKQKTHIFANRIIFLSLILIFLLIFFDLLSESSANYSAYPLLIPLVLIAALEVDSIKITVVALFNWFSITIFGIVGLIIWLGYLLYNFLKHTAVHSIINRYNQNFVFHCYGWQLALAILITIIWFILITRTHIRGREMITNWASGSTFVLVLFMSLWLPWFDNILTFQPVVMDSVKYLDKNNCIATNGVNQIPSALWYYYLSQRLVAGTNLKNLACNQAIVTFTQIITADQFKQYGWRLIYQNKRPIDHKIYYLIKRS